MTDTAAIEQMFGRRAWSRNGRHIHAIRNDAVGTHIQSRCHVRVADTTGPDQPITCRLCETYLAADREAANAPYFDEIAQAAAAITTAGFTLRYVDVCEGDGAYGLLGLGLGVTMWDRREVRIRKMLTGRSLLDVLKHELAHVREEPGFERGTHTLVG